VKELPHSINSRTYSSSIVPKFAANPEWIHLKSKFIQARTRSLAEGTKKGIARSVARRVSSK
jgi:hypothetical protein